MEWFSTHLYWIATIQLLMLKVYWELEVFRYHDTQYVNTGRVQLLISSIHVASRQQVIVN